MKFVYYNAKQEKLRKMSIGWGRLILMPLIALVVAVAAVGAISKIVFTLEEDAELANLRYEKATLENMLAQFSGQVNNIESRLDLMKKRDDRLRTYAEVPVIDEDTWNLGTGGSDPEYDHRLAAVSPDVRDDVHATGMYLEKFQQKVGLLMESLGQIENKLESDFELRAHTPSVNPVNLGIITSKFGYRKDPFIQQTRHHNGIDIVAEPGAQVVAPSDGVVEIVRETFNERQGLGKVLVINHGRGIRTRYGHLNKILVKPGQEVKRFDRIAEVGNTGRSTGPHLHYEVIVNGRFRNPMQYVLN